MTTEQNTAMEIAAEVIDALRPFNPVVTTFTHENPRATEAAAAVIARHLPQQISQPAPDGERSLPIRIRTSPGDDGGKSPTAPEPMGDVAGLVERLRKYRTIMRGGHPSICDAAATALTTLSADNARLKEALRKIADRARTLRNGTDDWFELAEFELAARQELQEN